MQRRPSGERHEDDYETSVEDTAKEGRQYKIWAVRKSSSTEAGKTLIVWRDLNIISKNLQNICNSGS